MRSPRRGRCEPQDLGTRATAFVLGGLAVTLAGLLFGVGALVVPGIGFAALGMLAPAWSRGCARGASASRVLLERRVLEGELLEGVLEVRGGRPILGGAVVNEEISGTRLGVQRAQSLRVGTDTIELPLLMPAGRRGRHTYPPPAVTFSDPLGLSAVTRPGRGAADEVIVLPKPEAVEWATGSRRRVSGEDAAGDAVLGAGEIDGLREYRTGTPAARIHWPALARGAGLLERRVVSAADGRPLVVIDSRCERLPEGLELVDQSVRAAASLILELARSGGCAVLLPDSRMPVVVGRDLRAWPSLHVRLALIEGRRGWRVGPSVRPEVVRGPVLYVACADGPEMAPAVRASPYTVIRVTPRSVTPPATEATFEVCGCVGHTVAARRRRQAA